jgi:hypothetical protein
MLLSEVVNIAYYVALAIAVVIFAFAAFRAFTIGSALVNRVYRNRAYFMGVFAVTVIVSFLLIPVSFLIPGELYFPLLFVFFIIVDSTILAALDTDFFHRNTLRWKQIRMVAYPLFVLLVINSILPPSVPNLLSSGIGFDFVAIAFIFIFVYTSATAVVSARRTPDKPLRRFIALAGLFLLGLLVNTLVFVFVSEVFSAFLYIVFAYISYHMAMSLSPVGKVEKEIKR